MSTPSEAINRYAIWSWMERMVNVASTNPQFRRPLAAFNHLFIHYYRCAAEKRIHSHNRVLCVVFVQLKLIYSLREFVIPCRFPPFPLNPQHECARIVILKQSSALNNKQSTMRGITISSAMIFYSRQQKRTLFGFVSGFTAAVVVIV